jgi:succinate dehydrogenase/fumarate reductase flavoprotein subunit
MKCRDIRTIKTDLLIIGGGGAAAMAALHAARYDVDISIASKETAFVGGATIQATGGVSILSDRNDNPDIFYNDIMAAGGYLNNPRLVRALADNATRGLLELEGYGYLLDRNDDGQFHMVKRSEGHMQARGYLDRRESIGFCHALERALFRRRVSFVLKRLLRKYS